MARKATSGKVDLADVRADLQALQSDLENIARSVKRQVTETGENGAGWVGDQLDELRGRMSDLTSNLGERSARQVVHEHPVSSLFTAFALGIALTSFFGLRHEK